jgi:branched-chain amino acid transport system substrate-binding protein
VAQLPRNIDGFLLLTGGTDTVAVEKSYVGLGGNLATHMLGGSVVLDPTSFTVGDALNGLTGATPVPQGSTDSAWTTYVQSLEAVFPANPKGSLAGSLFTGLYYNGMNAIIQGLKATITLDSNRNAIITNYNVQIVKQSDGSLGFKVLNTLPNVNETFNGFFGPTSSVTRDQPTC